MKMKILAIIVLLFLTMPLCFAEDDDVDLGWYEIEDWELAVCQDYWGGSGTIAGETGQPAGYGVDVYSNDIIITLQAERSDPIPFNSTHWSYIYEVSWYVQPLWTSVSYEVVVTDLSGNRVDPPIESGSSSSATGYSGYVALVQSSEDMLGSAILKVLEADISIEIPFIDSQSTDLDYTDLFEGSPWLKGFVYNDGDYDYNQYMDIGIPWG